jgi:hypothetical protein
MLPATVGILAVSAVVFILGWTSARRAARSRDEVEKKMPTPRQSVAKVEEATRGRNRIQDNNREHPEAMAMASAGDASKN